MAEGDVNGVWRDMMTSGTERTRMGEPVIDAALDPSVGTGLARALDGLRERKKAQTRDTLIECALTLFEERGYDATTIEDIAAAANVSPRTFFRYFDSKLDLVRAPKQEGGHLADLVAERPPGERAVVAVQEVLRTLIEEMLVHDAVAVRLVRVMFTTPSLRADALDHFHDHTGQIAEVCATRMGAAPGDLGPQVAAAAIGATMWTVVDRWVADGARPERLGPMLDEAFDLLASGLG
jgi:AcrR family transcriptional regulator